MAKRRSPRKDDKQTEPDRLPSPFAGLASLRDQLPQGDLVVESVAAPAVDETKAAGKVVVRHERKGRKGKTVTRISEVGADAEDWAQRLKRDLGCGGSVDADDIVLAGNLVDRAVLWLEAAGVRRVVRGS